MGASSSLSAWRSEVERPREHCAARSLEDTASLVGGQACLRWIYTHVFSEHVRHCGHTDLLRERIDGSTGVQDLLCRRS